MAQQATPATTFVFFETTVARTRRLSPTMLRVTLTGELEAFTHGGRDQRVKVFFPRPGQEVPVVPVEAGPAWFDAYRAADPATRAVMRSYTIAGQRRDPEEIDIDFALHGEAGPASRWALNARPGDRLTVLGPVEADNGGVDFRPPAGTDWVLLAGDETALPAITGCLASLPAGLPARVFVEVPDAADVVDLPTEADADVAWLVRDGAGALAAAVRGATLPDGTAYAWLAGEAATVRDLRRHLVGERGIPRRAVTFTGYWRRGATEEDLIAEADAGAPKRRVED